MGKLAQSFKDWIGARVAKHGDLGSFAKQIGHGRSTVENWRDGLSVPKLDAVDDVIEKGGMTYEDLGLAPKASPTVESLTKVVQEQEQRLAEFEALLASLHLLTELSPVKRILVERLASLDDSQVPRYLRMMDAEIAAATGVDKPLKAYKKADKA